MTVSCQIPDPARSVALDECESVERDVVSWPSAHHTLLRCELWSEMNYK